MATPSPIMSPARSSDLLEEIAAAFERRAKWFVGAFATLFVAGCWLVSATKLLWFDELATYYVARLPSRWDVAKFFADGLDVHTPLAALAMRVSLDALGHGHIGIRAPFIAAFLLMCLCLYVFVSRRAGPLFGLVAMLLPAAASTRYYATEARPYALLMGVAALAAVLWQNIDLRKHRGLSLAGLWMCLAVLVSLHYFAVVVLVPFGIAELVRWREQGRPDWSVLSILASAPLVLTIFIPSMRAARAAYTNGFWAARPGLLDIEDSYRFLLTLALAPVLAALVLWAMLPRTAAGRESKPAPLPSPERAFVASWALLPVFAIALGYAVGTFVQRYALAAIIGIAMYLALLAWRRSDGNRVFALVMTVVLAGWVVMKLPLAARKQMGETGGYPFRTAEPFAHQEWYPAVVRNDLPVAVTPAVFFFQFQHYVPSGVRPRVHYLASRKHAMQLEGMDTGDANLTLFAPRVGLSVSDYDAFVSRHKHFLLLAETTNPTWVVKKLQQDKAELTLRQRQGPLFIFEVRVP